MISIIFNWLSFGIFKLFLKHIHIFFLYFRSTSNLNYEVLNETETDPEVVYEDLEKNSVPVVRYENVYEGKEKTAEWPLFGIPREVNPFKTLRDLKGDISSLPDHSSNTYIPFKCANSETDSDISCFRHVRSSNSSDSSYTYSNPGFVCENSISSGSDNGDHYTDARSKETVLRDDVRNTNYHGNTVRINNRLHQNTELLDDDNYYNCDYDASASENGHSKNGSSNDSLWSASSSHCSLNNKQNEHEHRELENNETHTLMSTSENEITGTNIPLTDGSSDKSQKQPNNAKHRSRPHQFIAKATIANKETEPMNDDDNSSGNTSQTSSTYFITLPCAQSSSLDHDEQLPSRCVEQFEQDRVLQHSSNMTFQIEHDASIRPTHPPNSHEGLELYEDFESTSNDKLFSPPSTEMCSQPSTENDDYLTCVYDV